MPAGVRRFTSFVISGQQLSATGRAEESPNETILVAINIKGGSEAWHQALPAEAVKGGTAIDDRSRL